MSAANRRRGIDAEVRVVNWLRLHGFPDARRYLSGDGRQPGDIDAIPGLCVEVRDRQDSRWPRWCRDAEAEANGRAWVVVRRSRGVPKVGLWTCRWGGPGTEGLGIANPSTFETFLATFTDEFRKPAA